MIEHQALFDLKVAKTHFDEYDYANSEDAKVFLFVYTEVMQFK